MKLNLDESLDFSVCFVTFCQSNAQVLKEFQLRATILQQIETSDDQKKKKKLDQVEERINRLKENSLLSKPLNAFVTLNSQKTVRKLIKTCGSTKNLLSQSQPNNNFEIFGQKAVLKMAPDPSNILWSNYSRSGSTLNRSLLITGTLLVIYLLFFVKIIEILSKPSEFDKIFWKYI